MKGELFFYRKDQSTWYHFISFLLCLSVPLEYSLLAYLIWFAQIFSTNERWRVLDSIFIFSVVEIVLSFIDLPLTYMIHDLYLLCFWGYFSYKYYKFYNLTMVQKVLFFIMQILTIYSFSYHMKYFIYPENFFMYILSINIASLILVVGFYANYFTYYIAVRHQLILMLVSILALLPLMLNSEFTTKAISFIMMYFDFRNGPHPMSLSLFFELMNTVTTCYIIVYFIYFLIYTARYYKDRYLYIFLFALIFVIFYTSYLIYLLPFMTLYILYKFSSYQIEFHLTYMLGYLLIYTSYLWCYMNYQIVAIATLTTITCYVYLVFKNREIYIYFTESYLYFRKEYYIIATSISLFLIQFPLSHILMLIIFYYISMFVVVNQISDQGEE